MTAFEWTLDAADGSTRAGTFTTPHGALSTPVFAPVGTQATVKSLTPAQVEELGAQMVLAKPITSFCGRVMNWWRKWEACTALFTGISPS
jgi:glycine cleavage system protein P-like pyridoxal-binding family